MADKSNQDFNSSWNPGLHQEWISRKSTAGKLITEIEVKQQLIQILAKSSTTAESTDVIMIDSDSESKSGLRDHREPQQSEPGKNFNRMEIITMINTILSRIL